MRGLERSRVARARPELSAATRTARWARESARHLRATRGSPPCRHRQSGAHKGCQRARGRTRGQWHYAAVTPLRPPQLPPFSRPCILMLVSLAERGVDATVLLLEK